MIGEPLELRRGEEVEAELTIHYPEDVGERLEVGLECVERYDHPLSRSEASETVVERAVGEDIAYET